MKLRGKFLIAREEDRSEARAFLEKIGMTFVNGVDNVIFFIELRERPEILTRLESYIARQGVDWSIAKMTDLGICLYVDYAVYSGRDQYIFIPREHIMSIHTVNFQM